MRKEVRLPKNVIKKLQGMPESGMGYQIVNFKLRNGKSLNDLTVLNCSIALVDGDIDVSQVCEVELSEKKGYDL